MFSNDRMCHHLQVQLAHLESYLVCQYIHIGSVCSCDLEMTDHISALLSLKFRLISIQILQSQVFVQNSISVSPDTHIICWVVCWFTPEEATFFLNSTSCL